jgi:hypothetical protein
MLVEFETRRSQQLSKNTQSAAIGLNSNDANIDLTCLIILLESHPKSEVILKTA